jgi:RNA recognition motif-containing protein
VSCDWRLQQQGYSTPSRQLFVGNLPPNINDDILFAIFSRFGDIESIKCACVLLANLLGLLYCSPSWCSFAWLGMSCIASSGFS